MRSAPAKVNRGSIKNNYELDEESSDNDSQEGGQQSTTNQKNKNSSPGPGSYLNQTHTSTFQAEFKP